MLTLDVANLTIQYRGQTIVGNLSFCSGSGEVVAFMGSSGSGKTSILRAIGGIGGVKSSGRIIWQRDGKSISEVRPLGLLQQDAAIPPWFTASGYVRLCVTARDGVHKASGDTVPRLLSAVGLDPALDGRKVLSQLSGGMATRVALAGAIATGSEVMMLDEPFSMVDDLRRYELLDLTKKLLSEPGRLGFIVTHSALEAAFLADRIILLIDPAQGSYETITGLRCTEGSAAQIDMAQAISVKRQIQSLLAAKLAKTNS